MTDDDSGDDFSDDDESGSDSEHESSTTSEVDSECVDARELRRHALVFSHNVIAAAGKDSSHDLYNLVLPSSKRLLKK